MYSEKLIKCQELSTLEDEELIRIMKDSYKSDITVSKSNVSSPTLSAYPLYEWNVSPIPQTDATSFEDNSSLSSSSDMSYFELADAVTLESSFISPIERTFLPESSHDKFEYTKYSSCYATCESVIQLDGGNDEPFNGLTGINCGNAFLSSVITVFQSFEGICRYFDHHQLCIRAKSKQGNRCLFCKIRSLSLRLNRSQIRINLKPVEVLSQQDQLPISQQYENNFPEYFYKILDAIENDEEEVKESILGKVFFLPKLFSKFESF